MPSLASSVPRAPHDAAREPHPRQPVDRNGSKSAANMWCEHLRACLSPACPCLLLSTACVAGGLFESSACGWHFI